MSTRRKRGNPAADSGSPAAGRSAHRILIFTTVALALVMSSVDSTIVATALHALQHGLHTTVNWAGWTITAYSFGYVLMLPITGRLSEQYGRRRVFLVSTVTFTAASLLCGLVDNIFALIALRALQAAGGAGFTPSATGIVVDHFGSVRDRAVGLFGSIFPIGAMIGPIFGGLFVTYWTWRGVFFVNAPIGAAAIALALRYIPRDSPRTPHAHSGTDVIGIATLGIGLFGGMLAASFLGEKNTHIGSPSFLVPLLVAAAALWLFFHHINRSPRPLIAPHLVHGPDFGVVNLFNGLYGGITSGVIALIPLYASNRYGIGALASGTLLIAEGAAVILFTIAATLALRRSGHRPPLYVGCIVIALGMLALSVAPHAGVPPYAWLAASAFLIGVGAGTISPASRNAGLQLAPEHSSTLAALRSMSRQTGLIVTVSIAATLIAGAADPGKIQAWFDVAAAVLFIVCLPLIARIPEHHGSW